MTVAAGRPQAAELAVGPHVQRQVAADALRTLNAMAVATAAALSIS